MIAILIVVFILVCGIGFLLVRRHYLLQLDVAVKRAQKSNQMKTVFVENVSRVLRSPLKSIESLSSTILEMKDEEMQPAQVKKLVTEMSDNTAELIDFVKQLHEMSKFEGVTPSSTFIEVNLSELMASYRREAMNYARADTTIRVTTDLSPHCRAILDTNLMHQLMMHLLVFTTKRVSNGDIFVRYSCERRGLKVAVNYVDLAQAEHIDADAYMLLQDEDILKESGRKSILGLAICKAIVDMFGGEFFMESENGKNSVASFWFPCQMKDIYKDL